MLGDYHGHDRRRRAGVGLRGPSSPIRRLWIPALAGIIVLYGLFVIKVHYITSHASTRANVISGELRGESEVRGAGHRAMQNPPAPLVTARTTIAPAHTKLKKSSAIAQNPHARESPLHKQPHDEHGEPRVGAINQTPPPVETTKAVEKVTSTPVTIKPTEATVERIVNPKQMEKQPSKKEEVPPPEPVKTAVKNTEAPPPEPLQAATPKQDNQDVPPPVTQALVREEVLVDAKMPIIPQVNVPRDEATLKRSFDERHEIIAGYDQTLDYLSRHVVGPDESLFLFFTCSDDDFNADDWSPACAEATPKIYDVFAKSPSTNRLVTIRAGSQYFWEHKNDFRDDRDLRIKTVPCLIKWHGRRGETSGMMIGETLLDEPFLRYLFKNNDEPDKFLNAAAMVSSKQIDTVSSYEDYQAELDKYRAEPVPRSPLYLLFISGRLADNNRPWCPYCRFSELPMEYGFYAFAQPNARLLRVEVTPTYQEWKKPNGFNQDAALGPLRSVPGFYTIRMGPSMEWQFERIYERFDRIASLRHLFQNLVTASTE